MLNVKSSTGGKPVDYYIKVHASLLGIFPAHTLLLMSFSPY